MILQLTALLFLAKGLVTESQISPQPSVGSGAFKDSYQNSVIFSGRNGPFKFIDGFQVVKAVNSSDLTQGVYLTEPESRYLYSYFVDPSSQYFYIFGGLGISGIQGDFWRFEINDLFWRQISLDTGISARFDASSLIVSPSNSSKAYIYILGGADLTTYGKDDFYRLTIDQKTLLFNLTVLPSVTKGCFSSGLAGAQLKYWNNKLYLFSGKTLNTDQSISYFSHLCEFDIVNNLWKKYNLKNTLVDSSQGGSLVSKGQIYYFLGRNEDEFNRIVYRLNLSDISFGWIRLTKNFFGAGLELNSISYLYTEANDLINISVFSGTSEYNYEIGLYSILINPADDLFSVSSNPSDINPQSRIKASLVQIGSKMILFGGRNKNTFFNDLWAIEELGNSQKIYSISASGTYPIPRASHAAASQGNFMVIAGGLDENLNYLSDFWLLENYNGVFNWLQIVPDKSNELPPPFADTCLVVEFPYFIYIGGRSQGNLTNSIWKYNFNTNVFVKLDSPKGFLPVSKHGCFLRTTPGFRFLYVIFGVKSLNEEPSDKITKLRINDNWDVSIEEVYQVRGIKARADFAYAVLKDYLVVAGGTASHIAGLADIWLVDLATLNGVYLERLRKPVYSSAFLYYNDYLYMFSGYEGNGDTVNKLPSNRIRKIWFNVTETSNLYSAGFISKNNSSGFYAAALCAPGSYKSLFDAECKLCPLGTYITEPGATDISQCVLCPNGTYNDLVGQGICKNCSENQICLPGAIRPLISNTSFPNTQPQMIIEQQDLTYIYYIFAATFFLFIVFTLLWMCSLKFRVFFSVNDVYSKEHIEPPVLLDNDEDSKEEKSNYSYVGSFFTGVMIIILLSCVCYYIYGYVNLNITEYTGLVYSDTLDKNKFESTELQIFVNFKSLRASQNELCDSLFPTYGFSDGISLVKNSSQRINNSFIDDCEFRIVLSKTSNVSSIDMLNVTFHCTTCITSDISVGVLADAAYHSDKSALFETINAPEGQVFTGKNPSKFYFDLSPALFDDLASKNGTYAYFGYRVSKYMDSVYGSLSDLNSIYLNSGINIEIYFFMSQIGVYSLRNLIDDKFGYFGVAAGGIVGILETLGLVMNFYELVYFKIKYRNRRKEDKLKDELQRRIDASSQDKKEGDEQKLKKENSDNQV